MTMRIPTVNNGLSDCQSCDPALNAEYAMTTYISAGIWGATWLFTGIRHCCDYRWATDIYLDVANGYWDLDGDFSEIYFSGGKWHVHVRCRTTEQWDVWFSGGTNPCVLVGSYVLSPSNFESWVGPNPYPANGYEISVVMS